MKAEKESRDLLARTLILALDQMRAAQFGFDAVRRLAGPTESDAATLRGLGLAMFHVHINLLAALSLAHVEVNPDGGSARSIESPTSH